MQNAKILLGENIKRMREKKGWSLVELAQKADISHASIQRVETKKMWLGFENISKIANAFDISVAELFIDHESEESKLYTIKQLNELKQQEHYLTEASIREQLAEIKSKTNTILSKINHKTDSFKNPQLNDIIKIISSLNSGEIDKLYTTLSNVNPSRVVDLIWELIYDGGYENRVSNKRNKLIGALRKSAEHIGKNRKVQSKKQSNERSKIVKFNKK